MRLCYYISDALYVSNKSHYFLYHVELGKRLPPFLFSVHLGGGWLFIPGPLPDVGRVTFRVMSL